MRESQRTKKERASVIVSRLVDRYPDAQCALQYEGEGWKLLVMGCLSAQCTDKRVNEVCRGLFAAYPTPRALAQASQEEVEDAIRSCGLYRTKAKNIRAACQKLTEEFGGIVPSEMDVLLTFPGVGRKIANLLRGDLYRLPAIVADTHCIRISARLGLTKAGCKDPLTTERTLVKLIEPAAQADFCHRLVWFGREICSARAPKCEECPLRDLCASGGM